MKRSKVAVVGAVVVRVSVEVPVVAPLIVTEVGESAQVAGSLAAAGVIAQVSATAPVNPPEGVTLIVDVLAVVAPRLTMILPLFVRSNAGATNAFTVTFTVVVCVIAPEMPVTVTV